MTRTPTFNGVVGRAQCLVCKESFNDPDTAVQHHDSARHTTWSIPSSWLKRANVLSPEAFWREARRGI